MVDSGNCVILGLCKRRISEHCWRLLWDNSGSYTVCINKNLYKDTNLFVMHFDIIPWRLDLSWWCCAFRAIAEAVKTQPPRKLPVHLYDDFLMLSGKYIIACVSVSTRLIIAVWYCVCVEVCITVQMLSNFACYFGKSICLICEINS